MDRMAQFGIDLVNAGRFECFFQADMLFVQLDSQLFLDRFGNISVAHRTADSHRREGFFDPDNGRFELLFFRFKPGDGLGLFLRTARLFSLPLFDDLRRGDFGKTFGDEEVLAVAVFDLFDLAGFAECFDIFDEQDFHDASFGVCKFGIHFIESLLISLQIIFGGLSMFQPFPAALSATFPDELAALLDRQRSRIALLGKKGEARYENLLKPLQDMEEELSLFFTPLSHLNSVNNTPQTQKAYELSIPLLSAFHSELTQNEALYRLLKQITPDTPEARTVTEHTLRDFRLSGAELSPEDKERMEAIDLRLSQLSNTFSQNLLDATNAWEMILDDPANVTELPESDREAAQIEIDGKIRYRFTLQMPSYIAYMTYGSNRTRREELYHAYTTRAPKNGAVIDEILRLRAEKARLLGFEHYARYALQTRDAASETDVLDFLETLADAALPQARREMEELRSFAQEQDGITLAAYDVAYYNEKLKKATFDFDESQTKPYFEQNAVLSGLLDLVSELFDLRFEAVDVPGWDRNVSVYDLYEDSELSGRIYFDLEARESKRSGAWMHDWETHFVDAEGQRHLPSAFVVANFAPASEHIPSLLRHDDVVTLFHEMGHAIHHLLGRSRERAVSGINGVAWDVVEFPSQFLENFAYEEAILRRFAFHYESQKAIPESLIAKIQSAKNFQAALGILRQVEFALFDLQLHQRLYQGEEVQELLDTIRQKTSLLPPPEYNRFQHGFSHIFAGGYAAGYYSYKWAEVLSADAFFACLNPQKGFDPDKALGYRKHILSRGGSRPMSELYRQWLGHDPQVASLMRLYEIEVRS